jgi:hypothetical protein
MLIWTAIVAARLAAGLTALCLAAFGLVAIQKPSTKIFVVLFYLLV